MRLTYGMVKRIAAKELALNVGDTSRVTSSLNEAQERLMEMGKWKGTYQKYRFCVNQGCITLPREIEGVEAFAIEAMPGTVRNEWFEFLDSGPGLLESDDNIGIQLVDRGLACAFDDVTGTGKKLAVYCERTEASTAKIVLRYYDKNGQYVRTQQDGSIQDGEALALPAPGAYTYTANEVMAGGLVAAIKPVTNGVVRLYEYTVSDASLKPLGYYAPNELVPEYRRALIPDLTSFGCGGCENVTVDIMAKLAHLPLAGKDNDLLMIRSIGALKLACKAIKLEDANDFQSAAAWWAMAKKVLDDQLRNHLGDAAVQPVKTMSPEIWGAAISNAI